MRSAWVETHTAAPRIETLLAGRFQLGIHRESKTAPIYTLVPDKNGVKFRMSGDARCPETAGPLCGGFKASPGGEIMGEQVTMDQFAQVLTLMMGQRVINKTGLDGVAAVQLRWTPDETTLRGPGDPDAAPPDPNGPSIFVASGGSAWAKARSHRRDG